MLRGDTNELFIPDSLDKNLSLSTVYQFINW